MHVQCCAHTVQCYAHMQSVGTHAVHMHTPQADLEPQLSARLDASISVLVDLTGANERIFKSPPSRSNPKLNPTLGVSTRLRLCA